MEMKGVFHYSSCHTRRVDKHGSKFKDSLMRYKRDASKVASISKERRRPKRNTAPESRAF